MIKLKICTWGDYSEISNWAFMQSQVSVREVEGDLIYTEEKAMQR